MELMLANPNSNCFFANFKVPNFISLCKSLDIFYCKLSNRYQYNNFNDVKTSKSTSYLVIRMISDQECLGT